MLPRELAEMLELLLSLAIVSVPVLLVYLLVRVQRLGKQVDELRSRTPVQTPRPAAEASPAVVQPAPAAAPLATPPPLPPRTPPLPEAPSPLVVRLREMGVLPPVGLAGESALGAWWAARIGGLVGVAAVVFLGIWLNLTSELPPWLRLAQVVLLGAALLVGGLNLARRRPDLGRVVAAVGASVLHFSAWASQGLDRLRVVDSPTLGVFVQLVTAAAVAWLALSRSDRLLAQLATGFSAASLVFGVKELPGSPVVSGSAVACVALLGAIFLLRAGWFSAAAIGLVGSQLALLRGGLEPTSVAIAASLAFAFNWGAERLVRGRGHFHAEGERLAFSLASFVLPATALLNHASGRPERPVWAFICAGVAGVAYLLERGVSPVAASSFLSFALGLAAAGGAWLLDGQRLDWLAWFLAGGLSLAAASRSASSVLRWASEAFVMVAALSYSVHAYSVHPPSRPWVGLIVVALFAVLLGAREKERGAYAGASFLSVCGGLSMALVLLVTEDGQPGSLTFVPWLIALAVSLALPSTALRLAAVPALLWSVVILTFWGELAQSSSHREPALWSGLLIVLALSALVMGALKGAHAAVRHVIAMLAGYVSFLCAWHLTDGLQAAAAWRIGLSWACAGVALAAAHPFVHGMTRRGSASASVGGELSMLSWGAVLGAFVQLLVFLQDLLGSAAPKTSFGAPYALHACVLLVGLALHLRFIALSTGASGEWGAAQRALLPSFWLLASFHLLRDLPGAAASLGWAVAAMLTFLVGHLMSTRALRMVGLVGLAFVTLRIVIHDVTDLLGRVLACAALAAAFFAVAWVYGRLSGKEGR